jgi:hypothetical protein
MDSLLYTLSKKVKHALIRSSYPKLWGSKVLDESLMSELHPQLSPRG